MPGSRDDDSAPARLGQQLRARFHDVQGDDLDRPRDQTPGEAADFSDLPTPETGHARQDSSAHLLALALARFPLPSEIFPPDRAFWLTLYLFGEPAHYEKARPALQGDGWENLCSNDDFAGFSYPKKKVRNDVGQVRDVLRSVTTICQERGMGISLIDADTAFDPRESTFTTLYKEAQTGDCSYAHTPDTPGL